MKIGIMYNLNFFFYVTFTCSLFLLTATGFSFSAVNIHPSSLSSLSSTSLAPGRSSVSLQLVPNQGCQLAAASAAALAKKKLEEENDTSTTSSTTSNTNSSSTKHVSPSDATREFVSRLFHLPSQLVHMNKHHVDQQEDIIEFRIPGITNSDTATTSKNDNNNNTTNKNHHHHNDMDKKDDVVLFPIVGFQYVKLQDGSIRGIPTCNASPSKAVCNIDSVHMSHTQPLHGWYSKCCLLGNVYGDDDDYDDYCGEKRFREWMKTVNAESMSESKMGAAGPHPSEMI